MILRPFSEPGAFDDAIEELSPALPLTLAELARLRAPVCCRALCKYAGREDEPCWGEVGVDEDVSKNGGEIPHLCSGHWYGMYTPEPPAALAQGARAEGER